jgi:aminoglycoside phosphotransferase family enzyme/predicted kinase
VIFRRRVAMFMAMADDQHDVIAFLSDPSSYRGVDRVERLETHISLVFLAGDCAYKLKRAVRYPYLDFSTVERRRRFCAAELELNRRTAPQLYRDARPIARGADGRLAWGDKGEIVDWVVVMRRFDQSRRLDAIARTEGLTPDLLHRLAAHIAAFHESAEPRRDRGGAAALAAIIAENDACLRAAAAFPAERTGRLREVSAAWLERVGDLLDRRRAAGRVRRCHGDLHLRNICVIDGAPVLFDCIEFSDAFATIDVLYDLAFLLMDLAHQGDTASANRVLNRYLDLTGDDDGLAAMPLFLSLRAAIRAHVTASAGGGSDAAQAYLDQACAALRPAPPRLIAIGGLSGTGKSTVAAVLAPGLGACPGARVLRSDVIRKRLFGVAPESRLPEGGYAPEVTGRVYTALCRQAAVALRAGYCAIIDAVALRPDERQEFAAVARAAGVPFTGLWLDAPAATLAARVDARRNDASDATRAVVARQLEADLGPLDWRRVDAGGSAAETAAAASQALAEGQA